MRQPWGLFARRVRRWWGSEAQPWVEEVAA